MAGVWRAIQRIYEIHSVICQGNLPNCSTLAERLGVTRKTIQRDINWISLSDITDIQWADTTVNPTSYRRLPRMRASAICDCG